MPPGSAEHSPRPDHVGPDHDTTASRRRSRAALLTIAVNGGVTVDDATVIQADVEAENGVIHVIDRVLIPAA